MLPTANPTWLSSVSRRKLQATGTPDADKLLRKVLLRNSLTWVPEMASASSSTSVSPQQANALAALSSPEQPIQVHPDPEPATPSTSTAPPRLDEDVFVFPDATSLNTARVYSTADADAEARWLDSLLQDMSDDEDDHDNDEYDVSVEEAANHDEEEEEDDGYFLESLAWLLDEPQPILAVPIDGSTGAVTLDQVRAFDFPLPEDSDDDLSTAPDMDDDVESDADSVEWPITPGQRSMTSMLGRSASNSMLNQLVASGEGAVGPDPMPSIIEGAVFEADVRPAIHEDEPALYRYSPAPSERAIASNSPAPSSAC